jgi:hypothetical protein
LAHYRGFGYVEKGENGYRITKHAGEKFGFAEKPLKNEAPNAEASGPHESLGPGDQTGAVGHGEAV